MNCQASKPTPENTSISSQSKNREQQAWKEFPVRVPLCWYFTLTDPCIIQSGMSLLEASKNLDGYRLICQRRTGVIDESEADYLLGLRSFQVKSVIFPALHYGANAQVLKPDWLAEEIRDEHEKAYKGTPTNKLSNIVGWASCPPSS